MKPGGYHFPRRCAQNRAVSSAAPVIRKQPAEPDLRIDIGNGKFVSAFVQQPTAPTAPQRRSSVTHAGKKKKTSVFTRQQWICLAGLALAFVIALVFHLVYENKCHALIEKRIQAEKEYQQLVNRHRVKYREWIEYYAAVNNIDPAFVAAIIKRESDYDPRALSSAGARGLMQIMPENTQWLAGKVDVYNHNPDILYDPETNIKMGCWYLGYLSRMFDGDLVTVACGYHAGQGNVRDHWLKKYSSNGKTLTLAEIPMDDTKYYARKVLEAYAIYKQHHY